MTYSVLPTIDMKEVTVSPVGVRPSWRARLISFSRSASCHRGPVMTNPIPTIDPEEDDAGQHGAHRQLLEGVGDGGTALVVPAGEEVGHQRSTRGGCGG